jgi:hypothetical protein
MMVAIRPRCKASRPWLLRRTPAVQRSALVAKEWEQRGFGKERHQGYGALAEFSICSILAATEQRFLQMADTPNRRIVMRHLEDTGEIAVARWLARFTDETRPAPMSARWEDKPPMAAQRASVAVLEFPNVFVTKSTSRCDGP